MLQRASRSPVAWVLFGLVAGVLVAGLWRAEPSWASATDREENTVIATGAVAGLNTPGELEAVYVLDFTTGKLMASILNQQQGKFQYFFERDLAGDFQVSGRQRPRFLMVTGSAQVRRGTQQPIDTLLYVAELTTGKVIAYQLTYTGETTRGTQTRPFVPLDGFTFRQAAVRQQAR